MVSFEIRRAIERNEWSGVTTSFAVAVRTCENHRLGRKRALSHESFRLSTTRLWVLARIKEIIMRYFIEGAQILLGGCLIRCC